MPNKVQCTMYFVYLVLLVEMCSWWYIIRYSEIYISNQCRSNRAVSCMSGLVNFRGCPFSKLVWTYRDHIVLDRGQMHCFHYRYGSYFLVQTDEIIIIAFNSAIDNKMIIISVAQSFVRVDHKVDVAQGIYLCML